MIPEATRRDIFDVLRIRDVDWHGRLDEVEFLGRLWNVDELPSHDSRFENAAADIWQHRVNNLDWDRDWVFADARFNLFECSDDLFMRFIAETVHPAVRTDAREAEELVGEFNEHLRHAGWQLASGPSIAGRPTYLPQELLSSDGRSGSESLALDLDKRGFALGRKVGSGSVGAVYKAEQKSLGRPVAIKVFDGIDNDKLRRRFIHEARLLARLQHPSIPYVVTTGASGKAPYTVMQFVQGRSVREVLRQQTALGADDACKVVRKVLSALACAHKNDIVHRDVKPENILVADDNHAYLIDFSIGASLNHVPGLTRLTSSDKVPGTVRYMAPEVLNGEEWDHRIDIYAAGVVLFEMISGGSWNAAEQAALGSMDQRVANAIRRACAPKAQDRFASATDFEQALARATAQKALRDSPAAALCTSIDCPSASWDAGFTPVPIEATTDLHCRACGEELLYQCRKCGLAYDGAGRHCPSCGTELYRVPVCDSCNVPLPRERRNQSECTKCADDVPF